MRSWRVINNPLQGYPAHHPSTTTLTVLSPAHPRRRELLGSNVPRPRDLQSPFVPFPPLQKTLMLVKAKGEGGSRGWDGWMASQTQWTWVWAGSRSWWWTGGLACCSPWGHKGHEWATEQQQPHHKGEGRHPVITQRDRRVPSAHPLCLCQRPKPRIPQLQDSHLQRGQPEYFLLPWTIPMPKHKTSVRPSLCHTSLL